MLVSNIMMAHTERNSWSKLLTFISGSQADWRTWGSNVPMLENISNRESGKYA